MYQIGPPLPRKSAVDDTIDCGLFNFLYEKALKLRELRDTGVQIASGVPLFSFWGPGDRYGEGKNLNPSPVSLEGKLKDWRKIKTLASGASQGTQYIEVFHHIAKKYVSAH